MSRPRWYRLYYLLAAFDLFTVALSLVLNHQTRGIFERSVEINQELGNRLSDYAELAQLAQAVNAPGNDVFGTLDVPGESGKMHAALRAFEEKETTLRQEIRAHAPEFREAVFAPEYRETLFNKFEQDFDGLEAAMKAMTDESELMFSSIAEGRTEEAGRQMATMNRKYANVNIALAEMRQCVVHIQRDNFAQQEAVADHLAKFEYLLAGGIVLMIGAAMVYGRKLAQRVEADTRERDRYVERLRVGEAYTRSIVDNAADGIFTFDERGRVESANASAERMFDYPPRGLLGQQLARLIPRASPEGQDGPLPERLLGRDPATGGPGVRGELTGRRPDGTTFPLDLAVSELSFDGRRAFIAIGRDVGERKQAEAARAALIREQAAHAEADKLKDEFLANVSHDLRTPVAAIKASIGVVLANEPPGIPEPLHRMLTNIDLAADRMGRLVGDLLELTRLKAGRVKPALGRTDLRALALRSGRAIDALLQARGQQLELRVPAEAVWAWADAERLERALLNLLSNAHKYGRAGGTVSLGLEPRPGEVVLAVTDDGPGVPEADRERIFERFYRPQTEATARAQGSGLGLAIAHAMVELQGGRIWVESRPGGGTTFGIALPLRSQPTRQPERGGARVLVPLAGGLQTSA